MFNINNSWNKYWSFIKYNNSKVFLKLFLMWDPVYFSVVFPATKYQSGDEPGNY